MIFIIKKEGLVINNIVGSEDFVKNYCQENNYEYEVVNYSESENNNNSYIPTEQQSSIIMMKTIFKQQSINMDDETILQCSGLANQWEPGNHEKGEYYNIGNQTWECYQSYDNSIYPDIIPNNSSWYTFNRPLHGKTAETARPYIAVQGSHDMYKVGEYMIWTDGKIYECLKDTAYDPIEQPDAWKNL